jgi:hypothetical protein
MNRHLKYLYNELQKIMSSNFKRGRKLKNRAYSMMSNYFIIEKKKSILWVCRKSTNQIICNYYIVWRCGCFKIQIIWWSACKVYFLLAYIIFALYWLISLFSARKANRLPIGTILTILIMSDFNFGPYFLLFYKAILPKKWIWLYLLMEINLLSQTQIKK